MKYLFAVCCNFFLFLMMSQAQSGRKWPNHVLSIELGKTGLIYNLSFDQQLRSVPLGFRLLAGTNFAQYLQYRTGGAGVYYLMGRSGHFFELGLDFQYIDVNKVSDDQRGFAFVYPDYNVGTVYAALNLGYRVYGKKTMFRAGCSPGILQGDLVPGGYISLGIKL